MLQTIERYFRNKLTMRVKAKSCGIPVPTFDPYLTIMTTILLLNY